MTAHCYRCGYSWIRRKRSRPQVCPNRACCSRYWRTPPRKPVLCINCGLPVTEHEFVEGQIAWCTGFGTLFFQRPAKAKPVEKEGTKIVEKNGRSRV